MPVFFSVVSLSTERMMNALKAFIQLSLKSKNKISVLFLECFLESIRTYEPEGTQRGREMFHMTCIKPQCTTGIGQPGQDGPRSRIRAVRKSCSPATGIIANKAVYTLYVLQQFFFLYFQFFFNFLNCAFLHFIH